MRRSAFACFAPTMTETRVVKARGCAAGVETGKDEKDGLSVKVVFPHTAGYFGQRRPVYPLLGPADPVGADDGRFRRQGLEKLSPHLFHKL